MARIAKELLEEAFIRPIRFALLVDDEFPTYRSQRRRSAADGRARAYKLFDMCRSRNWLCDVENAAGRVEVFERKKHLHQSDLLILDWHLVPSDDTDASKAIRILQKLSTSDHFNLVVIYTGADVKEVASDLAFALGAGTVLKGDSLERAAEIEDELNEPIPLSDDVIDEYLSGQEGEGFQSLHGRLVDAVQDQAELSLAIEGACQRRFERRLPGEVVSGRKHHVRVISSSRGSDVRWVYQHNLFAAVVGKDTDPAAVVEKLSEAIESWSPSPLQVMLIHARARIEKKGLELDDRMLREPLRQAGWLLTALTDVKNDDEAALSRMYERLFSQLTEELLSEVSSFGKRLLHSDEVDPYNKVCNWTGVLTTDPKEKVYLAANEFLSSTPSTDGHVTVGTVFKSDDQVDPQYWICVTPACDLVPTQNNKPDKHGWEGEIFPLRAITAARLKPVAAAGFAKVLRDVTKNRHIFLTVDDEQMVFEVTDGNSKKLNLQVLILSEKAAIKGGAFEGRIIKIGKKAPVFERKKFRVLARLRPDYASKFLSETGQQKARIGVDWLTM